MSIATKAELIEEYAASIDASMTDVFDVAIGNACKHELAHAVKEIGVKLWELSRDGMLDCGLD